jgi:putative copper resistance protein D
VGRLSLARIVVLLLLAGSTRISSRYRWWLAGAFGLCAVALTSSVSHAAAQPVGRWTVMVAQMAHITTAAVWIGVLIHLLVARSVIEGGAGEKNLALLAEMVRRFSPVALAVTALLAVSGLFVLVRFLGDPGGLLTSAYGLTLAVKLLMLAPAVFAGWVNYRFIRPQLLIAAHLSGTGEPPKATLLQKFGRMLELEVTAGVLVVAAAGILGSVSPPGEAGSYRLTTAQTQALLSPRFPDAKLIDPNTFYGVATRTDDDLRYSEFTHHWSGVMVCLLGLAWLAQDARGRLGVWAGHGWPFLLVPFAVFVAVMSDPEIWLMRRVSLRQAIGDPQLLEHQLGAVIILVLVWLGWRDHRRPAGIRPLGYALPVIFVMGGVMLLGHAHSTLTVTEAVTNLINVQHAVFGAFLLFAGALRWLSLRELLPPRAANALWPCLVIGLGLFMTFFYREMN